MANITSEDGIVVEHHSPATDFNPLSLIRYVPEGSLSVLDCACRDGERGNRLKERAGRVVIGIDRHPNNAAMAEKHLDDVFCGEVAHLPLPFAAGQFDCILCDDVLAQVADPYMLLQKLLHWLSQEGILILTFPNLQYYKTVLMLAEGHWTYEDSGIMARENIHFFTGYEILKLLQSVDCRAARMTRLVVDDSENVTPDKNGCLQFGRITIGPLKQDEQEAYRTEQYLVLASKGAD